MRHRLAVALLALAFVSAWGCQSSPRAKPELVHVTRYQLEGTGKNAQRSSEQQLTIDLSTHSARLDDPDRPMVLPVDPRKAQLIRTGLQGGSGLSAPSKTASLTRYELYAQAGDRRDKRPLRWDQPSRDPLPPALRAITDLFTQASLAAHPQSERINLVD